MLAFQFAINILWIIPVAIIAFIVGLVFRSAQVARAKSRIAELDKDLLNSHAEILELLQEKAELEKRLKDSPIPVIPIKSNKEENNPDKHPDVAMRKKLLGGNQEKGQSIK